MMMNAQETMHMSTIKTHEVIDNQTGQVVGQYGSLKSAHRVADRRDEVYGAVRYSVRPMRHANTHPVFQQILNNIAPVSK